MSDMNGNLTVAVYPEPADLVLRLVQDGANVNLLAVDQDGNERFFGKLMTFEGNHGGHIEARKQTIADNLGLERDNERMKTVT